MDIPAPKPRIFLSAVSQELSGARRKVDELLRFLGYEVVTMEIWGTEPGDLRQMLRHKIDSCSGLLQIVGEAYGAEPVEIDPQFGRVSYTQFEFRYAQSQSKPTWLLFAGKDSIPDRPLDQLDLPRDSDWPDPVGYQQERRYLQGAYRHALSQEGNLYHRFGSALELENVVLKLNDAAKDLHEKFRLWQKTMAETQKDLADIQKKDGKFSRKGLLITLASVAGASLLGGLGLYGLHREGLSQQANQQKLLEYQENPEALAAQQRKQAVASYESKRQQLQQVEDPKERTARLADLDRMQTYVLATIDRLSKGRDDTAAPEMLELDRIMADKGAEVALSYVRHNWVGIGAAARHAGDPRKLLQVLLAGSKIAINSGDHELASTLLEEIFVVEPGWAEARKAYWEFLLKRAGPRAERFHHLEDALKDYEGSMLHADFLTEANPADAEWQNAREESRREAERVKMELETQTSGKTLQAMKNACQQARATGTLEGWKSFLATYGSVDLPRIEDDNEMLAEAHQQQTALASAKEAQIADEKTRVAKDQKRRSLSMKLASLNADLKNVDAEIEAQRRIYQDSLEVINRLTKNKTVGVQQGSQQYFECSAASARIRDVEAKAPGLNDRKSALKVKLAETQADVAELGDTGK